MSWLSQLFGGGGEDPLAIAQRQQMAADQTRREESARQAAQDALDRATQQQQYNDQLDFLKKSMQPTELDNTLQQQQIKQLQDESARNDLRRGATSQINSIFGPEFERASVPNTFDDPYINEAYAGERGKVDDYLGNLFKRGVITQAGLTGGQADIEDQGARVRTQLGDVGDALLEAQRGKLTDIANRGRDAASTLDIGQTFDPSAYSAELGQAGTDFASSFGDKFKAGIPGDLFDLSEIQQKAGAAQGAQNLAFDPNAVQGGVSTDTTDEETDPTKKAKRPVSVF